MQANGIRCTHGLKAGNCNTCPATRNTETMEWTFTATLASYGTRTVAGTRYKMNKHGILYVEDGINTEPGKVRWHPLFAKWNKELENAIYRAFHASGLQASCSADGRCHCPARF